MSFLAPFYLLAGLAIALPIAFHMIRRTPQGRQVFSSVMFLTPSPPRMTKRSRIEDWLLLVLRALAICLLAFAFARPFLREQSLDDSARKNSERITVLLDRSASMQRQGYWDRALKHLETVVHAAKPGDSLRILSFDTASEPLMTFEEWNTLPAAARPEAAIERAKSLQPGWKGTAAGNALLEATEGFEGETGLVPARKKLILISDLQMGGGWNAIQGSTWPEDVRVQVLDVSQPGETNASIQLVEDQKAAGLSPRVRVANVPNSSKESFQLAWRDEFATTPGPSPGQEAEKKESAIYVAPGQSRIVPSPASPTDYPSNALMLAGDDVPFDNVCYVVPRKARTLRIAFLSNHQVESSPEDLRFFLEPLFPSDATRQVSITNWQRTSAPEVVAEGGPEWVIIGEVPNEEQKVWLKNWIGQGGQALFVARDAQQAQSIYELLSLPPVPVEEAQVSNYAMLGRVDLDHPVLRQFNDPRFSDFTKLRFWKYRKFDPKSLPDMRILAALEDGSPALAEIPAGKGRVFLQAAGWNRDDSDLAVWSKFVPLMNSLLEYASPVKGPNRQLTVGDSFPLQELGFETETISVRANAEVSSHAATETMTFDRPGIYRFAASGDELSKPEAITIAVNLPAEESRTEPYLLEQLAVAGLPLDSPEFQAKAQIESRHQRQLMNQELESRQHWWRWLVTAGLLVLLVESALAAWKGRSRDFVTT